MQLYLLALPMSTMFATLQLFTICAVYNLVVSALGCDWRIPLAMVGNSPKSDPQCLDFGIGVLRIGNRDSGPALAARHPIAETLHPSC
jgi:hypothetical protein